jgi:hypothetical protein
MRTNGKTVLLVVLVALAGLGPACSGSTAPAQPSWDQDVFPILQGSCNGCHGATVPESAMQLPAGRYDVCNPAPFTAAGITIPKLTGASPGGALMRVYLNPLPVPGSSRDAMPPPPAPELGDYEHTVLTNWLALPAEAQCVKRGGNRPPSVRLVNATNVQGGLQLVLDISDPDGDQVLGKATSGLNPSVPILGRGRQWVVVPNAQVGDQVTVVIHDGYIDQPVEVPF